MKEACAVPNAPPDVVVLLMASQSQPWPRSPDDGYVGLRVLAMSMLEHHGHVHVQWPWWYLVSCCYGVSG